MKIEERELPIGLQSFVKIRRCNAVYVDKTDIVWRLAQRQGYFYLSRPRRFGKSLLVDTLACYFEGKRELFEGLKIMELEDEWAAYPVIHFDLSCGGDSAAILTNYLDHVFKDYEKEYRIRKGKEDSLGLRFAKIIQKAVKKTGKQVVILIDEYDSPLQHSWKTPEHEEIKAVYRNVFSVLKTEDSNERFVFITGITKFTQVSVFSVLNNLINISFEPEYVAICGITQQEVEDNFKPEIEATAKENNWTTDETLVQLKDFYDGYHFSARNMVDVYNPFSLLTSLCKRDIGFPWASTGATSMLPKFVENLDVKIRDYESFRIPKDILESSDVVGGPELFLFQTGYLTIKSADAEGYVIGIPNKDVRHALYHVVVPALTMIDTATAFSTQQKLFGHMVSGEVDEAMQTLKSLVSDAPYGNKKLASINMEERYRFIISSIFFSIGFNLVEVEHMTAKGRIDILVKTLHYIYIFELKLKKEGGLAAAEHQIIDRGYAEPFLSDGRTVIPLALELDDDGKGILGWKKVDV